VDIHEGAGSATPAPQWQRPWPANTRRRKHGCSCRGNGPLQKFGGRIHSFGCGDLVEVHAAHCLEWFQAIASAGPHVLLTSQRNRRIHRGLSRCAESSDNSLRACCGTSAQAWLFPARRATASKPGTVFTNTMVAPVLKPAEVAGNAATSSAAPVYLLQAWASRHAAAQMQSRLTLRSCRKPAAVRTTTIQSGSKQQAFRGRTTAARGASSVDRSILLNDRKRAAHQHRDQQGALRDLPVSRPGCRSEIAQVGRKKSSAHARSPPQRRTYDKHDANGCLF